MTWIVVAALAVAAFGLVAFVLKVPRGTREAVAAALVLGLAGYVAQGSPAIPGAPRAGGERIDPSAPALVELRGKVTNSGIPTNNRWIVIADGLSRYGRQSDAAEVLRGAIEDNPKDAEAWVALGNALVSHAEGQLTPPALYAFHRAAEAEPEAPGPPYFLGLAMAESGRFDEAHELWRKVLENGPEDAAWRPMVTLQLARLDALRKPARAGESADPAAGGRPGVPGRDSERKLADPK